MDAFVKPLKGKLPASDDRLDARFTPERKKKEKANLSLCLSKRELKSASRARIQNSSASDMACSLCHIDSSETDDWLTNIKGSNK